MMGPNMNGLYNMFGGVQQFQQRYNQVQQAFNQLRQQGMSPEQAAAQILQQNNVPQDIRNSTFQQANSMFGPAPGVQNPNPIQGGNNYGNNFGFGK